MSGSSLIKIVSQGNTDVMNLYLEFSGKRYDEYIEYGSIYCLKLSYDFFYSAYFLMKGIPWDRTLVSIETLKTVIKIKFLFFY